MFMIRVINLEAIDKTPGLVLDSLLQMQLHVLGDLSASLSNDRLTPLAADHQIVHAQSAERPIVHGHR